MNQKNIYLLLRSSVFGLAICGVVLFGYLIPFWGHDIVAANPEFEYCYWPWVIFIWIIVVPCYVALVIAWKISNEIKKDNTFSERTAKLLNSISVLAFCDVGIFFVGNVIFFLLNMNHPGIILLSLLVSIVGLVFAFVTSALSRFASKAAILQEQSDFTLNERNRVNQ